MKTAELAVDMDNCPKKDIIFSQKSCAGCEFYLDFFVSDTGLRCIRCSYNGEDGKENG